MLMLYYKLYDQYLHRYHHLFTYLRHGLVISLFTGGHERSCHDDDQHILAIL